MKATLTFSTDAFARKQIVSLLEKAAEQRFLVVSSEDEVGWFGVESSITVEGPEANVKNYLQAVENWR